MFGTLHKDIATSSARFSFHDLPTPALETLTQNVVLCSRQFKRTIATTADQQQQQQQPPPLQFETHPSPVPVAPSPVPVAPSSGGQPQQLLSSHNHQPAQLPEASALVTQQGTGAGVGGHQQQQQTGGIKPLVRTVNPGDRVNIPCSLANMGGSIQFAKDDQPIILDSGCAHCQLDISNDGQASLTINRVGQRDQGHWQCWRLDAQGKVKQKIPIVQLAVTNSPELPILIVNDKELLGGNNLDATITIKENEIVTFKCVIKGASTPVDYVHWILDSSTNVTQMSQLMMEYSGQESNYLTQSVLKLNATKSMNMKSISCLSNHQLWLTPMTVTAVMNVLYEPSFTISREPGFGVPVSEGMTVILKCEIDSNPSSSPIWIRDADNKTSTSENNNNQQQQQQQINGKEPSAEPIVLDTQEDGSLVFQPARQADSGWYRCKTENKYGNFSSFGYYLNVRPSGLGSGAGAATLASGNSVAPARNYPIQQQQQQQLQQQRARADSRIMGPNQAAAQVLAAPHQTSRPAFQHGALDGSRSQLANDQPQHVFQQQQQQHSLLAQDEARCRKVEGAPEIRSPVMSVQAVLGRQLILPLRFCCQPSPARVFWIHRHLAMIPGRMFGPYITREVYPAYNSPACYETTFEIEQMKPEDIGTVYVFVSNERGHAGAQIHIQLAKQLTANGQIVDQQQQQHSQFSSNQANNFGSRFTLGSSSASSSSVLFGKLQLFWLALMIIVAATIMQLGVAHQHNHQVAGLSARAEHEQLMLRGQPHDEHHDEHLSDGAHHHEAPDDHHSHANHHHHNHHHHRHRHHQDRDQHDHYQRQHHHSEHGQNRHHQAH